MITDSDAYVRDHLLIQFMLDYYVEDVVDVESVYKDWKNWVRRFKNAGEQKGSQI